MNPYDRIRDEFAARIAKEGWSERLEMEMELAVKTQAAQDLLGMLREVTPVLLHAWNQGIDGAGYTYNRVVSVLEMVAPPKPAEKHLRPEAEVDTRKETGEMPFVPKDEP